MITMAIATCLVLGQVPEAAVATPDPAYAPQQPSDSPPPETPAQKKARLSREFKANNQRQAARKRMKRESQADQIQEQQSHARQAIDSHVFGALESGRMINGLQQDASGRLPTLRQPEPTIRSPYYVPGYYNYYVPGYYNAGGIWVAPSYRGGSR